MAAGGTNDHDALQNWLSASQPHIGDVDGYMVTKSLNCNKKSVQGPATDAVDMGGSPDPLFRIVASSSFSDTTDALLIANDYCRLTGVGIDAAYAINGGTTNPIDAVSVAGTHVTIDGHSLIEHGHYNVNCGAVTHVDGLRLNDAQFVKSSSDNISLSSQCGNVRLVGDIVTGAGGTPTGVTSDANARGVVFGGDDMTIADGVVEQSAGIGIDLTGAIYSSVSGMFLDNNGKGVNGGAGIQLANDLTISICGNHISGNDIGILDQSHSAQIRFKGVVEGISLCGNVYQAEDQPGNATFAPAYAYDTINTPNGPTVTDTHFYETPARQAVGVYTPTALNYLPQLQVQHYPAGHIQGFTLSNNGTAAKVDIAAGEATDSSGTINIQNSSTCTVNLANTGLGGLDVSGGPATNTTYFFFVTSAADGGSPNCIASKSLAPSFLNTPYTLSANGRTISGNPMIYNVTAAAAGAVGKPSLGGVTQGDYVSVSGGTPLQIGNVGTFNLNTTGSWSGSMIVTVPSTVGLGSQMAISDPTTNCIPESTVISTVISPTQVTISNTPTCSPASGSTFPIVISGSRTITTAPAPGGTPGSQSLTVYDGRYRLVGALYTMTVSGAPVVVPFTQDGDTFYLKNSVADVPASGGGCTGAISAAVSCQLSVPCGRNALCTTPVSVEVFGRIATATNGPVLASSLDQNSQTPSLFGSGAGNTSTSSATLTAFPFRLKTLPAGVSGTSGAIQLQAVVAGGGSVTATKSPTVGCFTGDSNRLARRQKA